MKSKLVFATRVAVVDELDVGSLLAAGERHAQRVEHRSVRIEVGNCQPTIIREQASITKLRNNSRPWQRR